MKGEETRKASQKQVSSTPSNDFISQGQSHVPSGKKFTFLKAFLYQGSPTMKPADSVVTIFALSQPCSTIEEVS
jgi:hypothetical protein